MLNIQHVCFAKSFQSYLTVCNPMDCSLPGSSVHEIFQAKYQSGFPFPSPAVEPMSLKSPGLVGGFLTSSATWEVGKYIQHTFPYLRKIYYIKIV